MSTLRSNVSASRSQALSATSPGEAVSELLASALALLTRGFERGGQLHRDIRRLSAMDDRMLSDIGISRGDIERAVRHGRG